MAQTLSQNPSAFFQLSPIAKSTRSTSDGSMLSMTRLSPAGFLKAAAPCSMSTARDANRRVKTRHRSSLLGWWVDSLLLANMLVYSKCCWTTSEEFKDSHPRNCSLLTSHHLISATPSLRMHLRRAASMIRSCKLHSLRYAAVGLFCISVSTFDMSLVRTTFCFERFDAISTARLRYLSCCRPFRRHRPTNIERAPRIATDVRDFDGYKLDSIIFYYFG